MQSLTLSLEGATEYSGLTRSKLYELMGDRVIEARKSGRRVLIVTDSLRQYLEGLPPVNIRPTAKIAA